MTVYMDEKTQNLAGECPVIKVRVGDEVAFDLVGVSVVQEPLDPVTDTMIANYRFTARAWRLLPSSESHKLESVAL